MSGCEKKMSKKWMPVEKQPYNGQRVLLSFADEKQGPLVGTWKVDDEGGAFYAPFVDKTYAYLGYFVTAWMPLPEPYRESEDTRILTSWRNKMMNGNISAKHEADDRLNEGLGRALKKLYKGRNGERAYEDY